jgi:hypothetical protein
MSVKDELQKAVTTFGSMSREAQDNLGTQLARLSAPVMPSMHEFVPEMRIQRPEERAANSFMHGLRQHAQRLASGLRENQELQMYCYHGPENLRVLEISMPSENVVSLQCLNSNDEELHVTGHMHSVTFSYLVHTIVPPEVKRPIGFNMPSEEV